MNTKQPDIQQALSDIAIIRQALGNTQQELTDERLEGITLEANVILQVAALAGALGLALTELFTHNSMTEALKLGQHTEELKVFGMGLIGSVLIGLVLLMYFILWRAAQHTGEPVTHYITRNFRYIKNLSLISDLLMKFTTIALLIWAGKAEWVAPVLALFTGDYLLQGRFFTLPTRHAVITGLVCISIGIAMFLNQSALLIIPLSIFAIVSAFSIARLLLRMNTLNNNEE